MVAITDESAVLVERYKYDPYGKTKIFNPAGLLIPSSSISNTYAFTGRELDPETGLYYYRARWYEPEVGRFLSVDPYPGSLRNPTELVNKYLYCSNNPVNWIDPFGWDKQKKDKSWWEWYLYESVLPGPYGQPILEWGPTGPTFWGDPMKYAEQAGGWWKWGERVAFGTSSVAALTAAGIMTVPAIGAIGAATATAAKSALALPPVQYFIKQLLPPLIAAWMRWAAMEMPPNPVIWEQTKNNYNYSN